MEDYHLLYKTLEWTPVGHWKMLDCNETVMRILWNSWGGDLPEKDTNIVRDGILA